jgi:hypothetical protein
MVLFPVLPPHFDLASSHGPGGRDRACPHFDGLAHTFRPDELEPKIFHRVHARCGLPRKQASSVLRIDVIGSSRVEFKDFKTGSFTSRVRIRAEL